jgi:dinuclear metal center YbgI/SA1388 family protein
VATVADIARLIESFAPTSAIYEYDNVGLLVGSGSMQVDRILCCLDLTTQVLQEAKSLAVNLIITHHPIIFGSIKSIVDNSAVGRLLLDVIQSNIAVYSAHTNLDFVLGGINDYIADILGIVDSVPIEPYIDKVQGLGRVGNLRSRMSVVEFGNVISTLLQDNCVRIVGDFDKSIGRVAVVNGGGGSDIKYIDMALQNGADCIVTGDVKHHVAIHARECGIVLIEAQHYCMEYPYIGVLVAKLVQLVKQNNINVDIVQSIQDINPKVLYTSQ